MKSPKGVLKHGKVALLQGLTLASKTSSRTSSSLQERELQPLAVDAADAARLLSVAQSTLDNWRSLGIGPAYLRLGSKGGRVRYRTADLKAWLEEQVVLQGA